MDTSVFPKDQYYWQEKDAKILIGYLQSKIREYYDFLERTGLYWVMSKAYRGYYGGKLDSSSQSMFDSAELSRGGKQGQLVLAKANHYANVIDHTVQLTTSNKPAFQGRATNSDYKSLSQAIFATSITDYYWREKTLGAKYVEATMGALITGEASIHRPWDKSIGNAYVADPVKNVVIKEGDLKFQLCGPLDVVRRVNARSDEENQWKIVRAYVNRWDLIARHPDKKEDLLKVSCAQYQDVHSFRFKLNTDDDLPNTDEIVVWTAYHDKTDAMPKGRLFVFTGEVELYDGPTPYEEIPIDLMQPRTIKDTCFGFSPAWQILGVQQMIDILTSTIITNQATNGVNNLWTKKNDPVSVAQLSNGMNNMQSEEMPQVVTLLQTPAEIFNFRTTLIGELETLSGINSTVRGNPEASLKSGSALALVVSQAVQFASLLEGAVQNAQEKTATGIIKSLKAFSKSKRVANIIGVANRSYRKEFEPEQDLAAVSRVVIEPVNPLAKTISGRLELAQNMLQQGMIKTQEQYFIVLQTGQLDPALESSGSFEMLNIRAEGEYLREGKEVAALISDKHLMHIVEHLALLSTPEAREDPRFVGRVLAHVADHEEKWLQISQRPALLAATQQQALPPAGPAATPGAVTQQPQEPAAQSGAGEMPSQPNMPNLPPNADENSQIAYEQMKGLQQ